MSKLTDIQIDDISARLTSWKSKSVVNHPGIRTLQALSDYENDMTALLAHIAATAEELKNRPIAQVYSAGGVHSIHPGGLEPIPGFAMPPTDVQQQIQEGTMTPLPAPAPIVPKEPNPAVQYATASQKEEIIRLLNHPVITRQEKTKMLLNINRLDEERAVQAIAKLRKAIDERENGEQAASSAT